MNAYPTQGQSRKTTLECCIAIWHRMGNRYFTYQEVRDLLTSPSQLRGMENRGYVQSVGVLTGVYRQWEPKIWQVTNHTMAIANTEEGERA